MASVESADGNVKINVLVPVLHTMTYLNMYHFQETLLLKCTTSLHDFIVLYQVLYGVDYTLYKEQAIYRISHVVLGRRGAYPY